MATNKPSGQPLPISKTPPGGVPSRIPIAIEPRSHALGTPDFDSDSNHDEESDEPSDLSKSLIRDAPAWMTSMVFHMILLVVIALTTFPNLAKDPVELEATFAEQLGEQLDLESFTIEDPLALDFETPVIPEQKIDESFLEAMPKLLESPDATRLISEVESPNLGNALDGRKEGAREVLVAKYGGTAATERAVLLGLQWLARNQNRDGSWSLKGPYSGHVALENRSAATAMALLAFQGAGHTHLAGQFQTNVARGWKALLKRQQPNGDFYQIDDDQGIVPQHHLYTHAQATIAICELYGMTRDETYRAPALSALRFCDRAQSPMGGWKYKPGGRSDLSVTGWFVMALQSARMAGLPVEQTVLDEVNRFLRSVQVEGGRQYSYQPGYEPKPAMTAEGLLCRQYLGWKRADPRLVDGINYLVRNPVKWTDKNVYYWYYATQAVHHMEGDAWDQWNRVMRQVLPENQVQTGDEQGSWDPDLDPYAAVHGGRLFSTCLCLYNLEVYYRHLPIYSYRLD